MKVNNNSKHQPGTTVNKKGPQPQIFNPKKHRKETSTQALKKHLTVKNIALGALLLFGGVFSYREFYNPNDPIQQASFKDYNEKIETLRNSILLAQKHTGNENNHELFKEANACLETMTQAGQCPDKISIQTKTLETKTNECLLTATNDECSKTFQHEIIKVSNLLDECSSILTEAKKCPGRIMEISLGLLENILLEPYVVSINTAVKKEDLVRPSPQLRDEPLLTDSLIKQSHHTVERNTVIKNAFANIKTEDDDYNEELKEDDVETEELDPEEIL